MVGLSKFSKMQDYRCACCGSVEYNGKYDVVKNTMVCTSCWSSLKLTRARHNIIETIKTYEASSPRPDPARPDPEERT